MIDANTPYPGRDGGDGFASEEPVYTIDGGSWRVSVLAFPEIRHGGVMFDVRFATEDDDGEYNTATFALRGYERWDVFDALRALVKLLDAAMGESPW